MLPPPYGSVNAAYPLTLCGRCNDGLVELVADYAASKPTLIRPYTAAKPLRVRLVVLGGRGPDGAPLVLAEFIHAVPTDGTPVQTSGMYFHEPVTGYRLEVIPW